MRYAECFAGVGGLSRGLESAGMQCAWHAEIADFPRRVLAHHWPDTPLYGDVTTLDGRELVARHGPIDLMSGGAPCQDLSVAGKRAGLEGGTRSVLFFDLVRLWHETNATYFLYENVAGALSSNTGADFALVLSAIVGGTVPVPSDGWRGAGVVSGPAGVAAWRLLDAQWFGVPQRRLRVFVLGTRAGGCDPAEVLLEPSGVRRNPPARGEAREGTARGAGDGAEKASAIAVIGNYSGGFGPLNQVSPTLQASGGGDERGKYNPIVLAFGAKNSASQGDSVSVSVSVSPALDVSKVPAVLAFDTYNQTLGHVSPTLRDPHGTFGDALPAVVAFDTTQVTSVANRSNPRAGDTDHPLAAGAHAPLVIPIQEVGKRTGVSTTDVRAGVGIGNDGDPMFTLQASAQHGVVCTTGDITHSLTQSGGSEDGTGRGTPIVVFNETGHEKWTEEAVAGSLNAHEAKEAHTIVGTLNGSQRQQVDGAMVATAGIPRRLMPIECERLMGWEPGWTNIPDEKGKPASDSGRYRACGNGVCSSVAQWIAERLFAAHGAIHAD